MLKSHSGASASSISYVDIYVYPIYDTTTLNAAGYVTDVKSRFGAVDNPIGLDLVVDTQQYSSGDCTTPIGGPIQQTFSIPISASVFSPYSSTSEVADPSAASLRIVSIDTLGVSLNRSPQEIITGSYVYRIFGYGVCQGL